MVKKTTVLLVDDHPLIRKGLRALFSKEPNIEVKGEANNGSKALKLVDKLSPNIVIMDITMPDLNGIDACQQIVSAHPQTKVIALSIHSGKRFVENMLNAGASGYVLKDTIPEELVKGIKVVMAGQIYLSPAISGVVVSQYKKLLRQRGKTGESLTVSSPKVQPDLDAIYKKEFIDPLTDTELEVLKLLSQRLSYKECAQRLTVSPNTVKKHVVNIYQKLNVHRRSEAIFKAKRLGIIPSK